MKPLMTYILGLLWVLLLFPVEAKGNNEGAPASSFYNIPTPNASELLRFGNIPVNYHSGTANISVPLYQYSCGGVDLDVCLQYDASGLPMNRLPGWTGHGWTLLAGGSITRNKIGFPDDMALKGSQAGSAYNNYDNYFKNLSVGTLTTSDISPDVFCFNFLGKSGRFFMGSDGQWKVISDDIVDVQTDVTSQDNYINPFIPNIQVEGNLISYPKTIKGFTLVDENGTKYVFGGNTNSIEYSAPFLQSELYETTIGPQNFWTADSWMLTSVTDRLGNRLYDFSYERGKFVIQISPTWRMPSDNHLGYERLLEGDYASVINAPLYLSYVFINGGENLLTFSRENAFPDEPASWSVYPSFYNNGFPVWNCSVDSRNLFYYAQTSNSGIQQYQASYPSVNKHLDPLSSMELDLLKDITSTDGVSYSFGYDYDSRIHLDELTIHEGGNSPLLPGLSDSYGKYRFVYNDYTGVPSDYMTERTDYWGYYNGSVASNNGNNALGGYSLMSYQDPNLPPIIPDDSLIIDDPDPEGEYPYSRRIPDFSYSSKGMLTDLIYPTGGRTHFEYGQNTCSTYIMQDDEVLLVRSENDFEVPGLRIRSISSFGADSALAVRKDYDYTVNGRTSGELYHVPVRLTYDQLESNNTLYPNDTILGTVPVGLSLVEYDSGAAWGGGVNSLTPLWDSRGPHMGYQVVTESSQYGKTTYKYQGYTNAMFLTAMANPNTFSERQYCKGILLEELYYDQNLDLRKTVSYSYGIGRVLSQSAAYLPEFCLGRLFTTTPYNSYTLYDILFPRLCMARKTQKELLGNNWVTTTTSYKYEDVNLTIQTPYEHNSMIMVLGEESTGRMADTLTLTYNYLNCVYGNGATPPGGLRAYIPYPDDDEPASGYVNVQQYESQGMSFFFPRTTTSTFLNGEKIRESYIHYDCQFQGFDDYLPAYELEYKGGCLIPDTTIIYKEYGNTGGHSHQFKLKKYVDKNGVETSLLWNDYGNLAGVVQNSHGTLVYNNSNGHPGMNTGTQGVSSSIPDEIFGTKPTSVSECFYNSKGQIEKVIKGNNMTFLYGYDSLGRLTRIKDNKNNILKKYMYNYRLK